MSNADAVDRLRARILDVPDFPKPGVVFKDITPLLADAASWQLAIGQLCRLVEGLGATKVVGIESRGFVLGAPVADRLGVGFVPVRKPGKLPRAKASVSFDLEYGEDDIEVHLDATGPGERVVVLDDVLATGGTAAAAMGLMEAVGARVAAVAFLVELTFLNGRSRLEGHDVRSVITY